MISSGTTAIATTDDTAVAALVNATGSFQKITIVNEGTAAGFYSPDGGGTWPRLPAAPSGAATIITFEQPPGPVNVLVKRIASGTDLSGIYVSAR